MVVVGVVAVADLTAYIDMHLPNTKLAAQWRKCHVAWLYES